MMVGQIAQHNHQHGAKIHQTMSKHSRCTARECLMQVVLFIATCQSFVALCITMILIAEMAKHETLKLHWNGNRETNTITLLLKKPSQMLTHHHPPLKRSTLCNKVEVKTWYIKIRPLKQVSLKNVIKLENLISRSGYKSRPFNYW